jgi:hypothetical protein
MDMQRVAEGKNWEVPSLFFALTMKVRSRRLEKEEK